MADRSLAGFLSALCLVALVVGLSVVAADEPNVGVLRVAGVKHPRQVAPSAKASLVIDVEYAIRLNATIKSSLFEGSPGNLGAELWHSEPAVVSGGGDRLWTVNLTAPSKEGDWLLTVFAYYQEGGKWKYYNDSDQGPSYIRVTIKIARLANLEIRLGVSDLPVTVEGTTQRTSMAGGVTLQLAVGQIYRIGVPSVLQLENSTRLVFLGWQDGNNNSLRSLMFDGDQKMVGSYKMQYLLRVNSVVSKYSYLAWYDPGSSVKLQADSSVPLWWPLGSLGLRYVFQGWSGSVHSSSTQLNITMNKPQTISANFALDYTPLVLPTIFVVGVVGGILLSFLRRRAQGRASPANEVSVGEVVEKLCENCGEPIEEGWTHCAHCGKDLGLRNPSKAESARSPIPGMK